MKKTIVLLFLTISSLTFSQAPNIEWQKCLGSAPVDSILVDTLVLYYPGNEEAKSIIQTSDGGMIIAGTASGNNGDVSGLHIPNNYGSYNDYMDVWIVKLDGIGNIQWQKCIGGNKYDGANDIIQTSDGGYILAGTSNSNNGDVSGNHGNYDYWVVKLSSNGNIQWQKSFGGFNDDIAYSIKETPQGGYIIAGKIQNYNITSGSGNIIGYNGGGSDGWLIKISNTGVLEWQKCIGGNSYDQINDVLVNSDGSFIIAGTTSSFYDAGNHGASDFWVVKLNSIGNVVWQKCYGGTGADEANSLEITSDGAYIVVGSSTSHNGDVTWNNSVSNPGNDMWILKINDIGDIIWEKSYGGTAYEIAYSVVETTNGNFIITGCTFSWDGDVQSVNHGVYDFWVIELSNSGNILWEKCFGGTSQDISYDLIQVSDGGYIITGFTQSSDYFGDVFGNHGVTINNGGQEYSKDVWLIKLSAFNSLENSDYSKVILFPNPFSNSATISIPEEMVGTKYYLTNCLGMVVFQGFLVEMKTELLFDFLSNGVYNFQFENSNEIIKIIKQ